MYKMYTLFDQKKNVYSQVSIIVENDEYIIKKREQEVELHVQVHRGRRFLLEVYTIGQSWSQGAHLLLLPNQRYLV